jgi:hypothetical protein
MDYVFVMTSTHDLIDLGELCELGKFSKDAYRALRRRGLTPVAYKMGRNLYFKRSDAEAWLLNVRMVRLDPPKRVA